LEKYNACLAGFEIESFVGDFSTWYIRRCRNRVGPNAFSESNKLSFYQTTYEVLVNLSKILAPLIPYISEIIYRNLTKEESVHLGDWPSIASVSKDDEKLFAEMSQVREFVERIHAARKEAKIPVRQPLLSAEVNVENSDIDDNLLAIAKDEVNLKKIDLIKGDANVPVKLDTTITPELEEEAKTRELIRQIQSERKNMNLDLSIKLTVFSPWVPKDKAMVVWLKKKTATHDLKTGPFKIVAAS
jgi:isoleucyl-tRNA synthetase